MDGAPVSKCRMLHILSRYIHMPGVYTALSATGAVNTRSVGSAVKANYLVGYAACDEVLST